MFAVFETDSSGRTRLLNSFVKESAALDFLHRATVQCDGNDADDCFMAVVTAVEEFDATEMW